MARQRLVGGEDTPAPSSDNAAAASPVEELDRRTVARAIEKRRNGDQLTVREESALRKHIQRQEDAQRERLYETMPKRDYVRLSGKTYKVLADQASRHGLPIPRGKTVPLGGIIRRFHELLTQVPGEPAPLTTCDEDDDLLNPDAVPTKALERYQLAKAKREEIKLAEDLRQVIQISEVREGLRFIFGRLRSAGDVLQREFGPGAHRVMDEALSDAARDLLDFLEDDDGCSSDSQSDSEPSAGSARDGAGAAAQNDA